MSNPEHLEYIRRIESECQTLRSQLEAANARIAELYADQDSLIEAHRQEIDARMEMTDKWAAEVDKVADITARKDGAYLERNRIVAALAKCFPSGKAKTAIEGWSEDWHGCVYIDLPTGQVSWHYHDSHAHLFEGLPEYAGQWDGHDTPEKYARLGKLTAFANLVAERAVVEVGEDAKRLDRIVRQGGDEIVYGLIGWAYR